MTSESTQQGDADGTAVTVSEAARAGRREWTGLAVIALPCLVYAMDLTVLNLAVPSLSADLQPSSSQLLWIVDIYGFLVAGLLITMGTLGDRIGRRRLLLIGAAAFGVASVLAAFSTSAEMLIAARALLGVAGATLAPSTLSLIRNMFHDPGQRTVAIGVWITSFSAGAAIGPLVGGALLEQFWWGSVFLVAVPVMALLLAVGPRLLPEFRDPEAGRLDLTSAALSLVGVLAVIYGLKQVAQDGAGWSPAVAIVAGLAVGGAFIRRQGRLADPLIDLRLFRAPAFSAALAAYTLGFFVSFGALLFIAQYLQLVLELSPLEAGAWTVPSAAGFIVGAMLTPMLARRVPPGSTVAGGLALAAVGFGLLTQVDGTSGLAVIVIGSVVFSLGLAAVFTLATDLMVGTAPPERAGAASAIAETGSEFGGALGIAILGTIGTAVYRSQVADAVPAGVTPQAAEAARDTLGGAVAAGDQLPDPFAAELLDVARESFTQGLQLAAGISAAVVIVAGVLAVVLLRRVGPFRVRAAPRPEAGCGRRDRLVRREGGGSRRPRGGVVNSGAHARRPARSIDVNGTKLSYEEHGKGIPLVLIHGGLGSSAVWKPLIPELSDGFRVITPDSRGHGRSTNPAGQLSYARIADDVAALIAALGLIRPVVGGWSDGGQATLELASRHAGVAGALIVGAAYPDFAGTGLRDAHRTLLGADDAGAPDLERLDAQLGDDAGVIKSLHPGGPRQWRTLVQQTAPMWLDYAGLAPDELRAIETPTLVLTGDRDELIPLDLSVALYRALPHAELAVCPQADHGAPMTPQRGAVFAGLIRDFALRHATA